MFNQHFEGNARLSFWKFVVAASVDCLEFMSVFLSRLGFSFIFTFRMKCNMKLCGKMPQPFEFVLGSGVWLHALNPKSECHIFEWEKQICKSKISYSIRKISQQSIAFHIHFEKKLCLRWTRETKRRNKMIRDNLICI